MRRVRFLVMLLCALLATGFLIPAASTVAQQSTATPPETSTTPSGSHVDPRDVLTNALRVARTVDPVAGPTDGKGDLKSGSWKYLPSGVDLSVFYAAASFVTPPNTPAGNWTTGVVFWSTNNMQRYYALNVLDDDGVAKWEFGQGTQGGLGVLQSGVLPSGTIDFTPGAVNTLGLVVNQGLAILSVNDQTMAATVRLGDATGNGDVMMETGFTASGQTQETLPVSIQDFAVWDLSPAASIPEATLQPTQIPAPPSGSSGTGATPGTLQSNADAAMADANFATVFGQAAGGPWHGSDDVRAGNFSYLSGGVDLAEFFAGATFITPPSTPAGSWTIGFAFWSGNDQPTPSDVFIQARDGAARWGFGQNIDGSYRIRQQGILPPGALDFTPGSQNVISLIVARGVAILVGNDQITAATIDLGGAAGQGGVDAEVGFSADDPNTTQTLPFSIPVFVILDLSPAAMDAAVANASAPTPTAPAENPVSPTVAASQVTPAPIKPTQAPALPTQAPVQPTQVPAQPTQAPMQSTQAPVSLTTTAGAGENTALAHIFDQERTIAMANGPVATVPPGTLQQQSEQFTVVSAGVSLANVYVTATFVTPSDLSTSTDIGIGFRDQDDNAEFRFVVASDGVWGLSIGAGSPLAQGTLSNFDTTPGASNTLEVIAQGGIGLLALNGVVIQQVDLSANLNAGDVYIGSGMFDADSIDGRQVPYSNVAVYQLPS